MPDAFFTQKSIIIDKDIIQSHFCVKLTIFLFFTCSFRWRSWLIPQPGWMRVRRSSIHSLWLLEVWSHSPVTTRSSESLLKTSSRTTSFAHLFSFNQNSSCSNNCEQDAVLISLINGCTSVYSATVIYSIIGFRAMQLFDDCMAEWVPECKDHVRCNDRRHFAHLAVLLFDSNILKVTNFFNYPEGSVTQSNYEDVLHNINVTNPGTLEELDLAICNMERFLSEVSIEYVENSVV